MFDTDEHVRGDSTLEGMAQADGGVHQGERHRHRRQRVGHQRCGRGRRADGEIRGGEEGAEADGAARRRTATPASIRRSWASGPVSAVKRALAKAGLKLDRHGRHRIERGVRRAGARRVARNSAWMRRRSIRTAARSRSAIRSAPPAAILTVKAMYELQRTGGRYALITMCIGGGQGIAAIIERI